MENCSRHADLFVRLFARVFESEVPPTLSVKISTLYHNFLIDYCRDFSYILHICTRPQLHSLVSIRSGSFLDIFFMNFLNNFNALKLISCNKSLET